MNVTIEKIEIVSFGKLKNAVVSAASGINILSAPNESGKSTLAAFIKFAFYGFAGARVQTLTENEKKLYTPWDSEISEGSITINADGEKYIVHRRCPPSGKEVVEVTHRNTGRLEFPGEVPGEAFFGVGEDVFSRTLFFRQLTAPQSKDELLADRLRNIAISADEQVGTKKAVARLTEAKNELKGRGGNGLIPKAERERDSLEEAITASVDLRREVVRLNTEIKKRASTISDAQKKLSSLNDERLNIEKYEALMKVRNINRLAIEEEDAREEYQKASAGLKKHDDGGGAFRDLFAKNSEYVAQRREYEKISGSIKEIESELDGLDEELPFDREDAKQIERAVNASEKISKILFIAAAIAAVAGLFIFLSSGNGAGFLGIALGVICAAVGMVFLAKPSGIARDYNLSGTAELKSVIAGMPVIESKMNDAETRLGQLKDELVDSRTNLMKLKKELDEGIGNYIDDAGNGDYAEQLEQILAISAESGEKLAVWRAKREELVKASEGIDVDALNEEAKGAVPPERDRAKVDREISFYTSQLNQLSDLNRRDELECAAFEAKSGDPATLVGKRDSLVARIDDLNIKHKAYETATRVIDEAADYMKSMVAPRISERADEYFTAATGGKYSSFEVDTKLSMSFGEDFRRSCDYLSAGTRDSAYLSLRLALADMLFGGCGVPILLDDAFGRMDDNRLRMISGAINEAAKKHQIFILTHGNREKDALEDINAEYNEISIKTV